MTSSRATLNLRNVLAPGLLVLALLISATAGAQSQDGEGDQLVRAWTLGIALGHGRRSNPFVASDDVDMNAVLDLAWYGEHWFFDNGDIGYTLQQTSRFSLNAVIGFNNERNYFSYLSNGSSGIDIFSLRGLVQDNGFGVSAVDDEELERLTIDELEELVFKDIDSELPDRDFAVNGGFEMLYLSRWGDLQAQVFTDLASTHNGQSAWLSYSYPWLTARSEYSFTVGLEWKSKDLVDYYYGVKPHEALPGRPRYRGESGTNTVLRVAANHSLGRNWKLVSVLEREYLSGAIRSSPIIKDSNVDTFYIGLYYQF